MTTLADYRDERLRKLEEIRARGIDPYPAKSHRNTKISTILNHFDEKDGQEVVVAGRIMAIRSFGKLAFVKIRDYTGEVQIFMEKTDQVEDGHFSVKELKLLAVELRIPHLDGAWSQQLVGSDARHLQPLRSGGTVRSQFFMRRNTRRNKYKFIQPQRRHRRLCRRQMPQMGRIKTTAVDADFQWDHPLT